MRRAWLLAATAIGWAVVAWLMLLRGLGSVGLIGPDEPRYAAIAAAMARTGDFITPRLWGAPWLEKPILYYWLAALSQRIEGIGDVAARLPNALLTALLSLALGLFLWRVHSARAGALAALLTLTSAMTVVLGRAATTDMTLATPLAIAIMALYLWLQEERMSWLAGAAVALALATLAKGPVAVVLAALTLVGFAASQRRWRLFPALLRPGPVILFFAVAAPWYIGVQWRNPEFFRVFFLQHNLERFASNRFQHPQPFWFYVPVILLAVFPWSGWLGLPLTAAVQRVRRLGWRRAAQGADQPLKFFLGWWALAPLVFFSLSQSKLPGYILPALPAAVALIAVCATECWERIPRWPLAISALLTALVPGGLDLAVSGLLMAPSERPTLGRILADPSARLLVGGAAAVLLVLVLRRRAAAAVTATCMVMMGAVLALTFPPLSSFLDVVVSGRPLAQLLAEQCRYGLPRTCGTVALYSWRLNRGQLYGAEYYLGAELAEWPEATPPESAPMAAIVVMDRGALDGFIARYGGGRRLVRFWCIDCLVGAAPWLEVRVAPMPRAP